MPLTGGQIVGHDNERLAFAFTMMNDGETIQCQISDAAMDELAEEKGTLSIARQAQFVAHRDTIERIASDLYDKAPRIKGYVVRIFTKHIQGAVAFRERCSDQADGWRQRRSVRKRNRQRLASHAAEAVPNRPGRGVSAARLKPEHP